MIKPVVTSVGGQAQSQKTFLQETTGNCQTRLKTQYTYRHQLTRIAVMTHLSEAEIACGRRRGGLAAASGDRLVN